MAPPLNSWPYSHAGLKPSCDNKCILVNIVDNLRNLGLNFTYIFIILQVIISLSAVSAGPVILSLDYLRGPVATARNIRHLPCISRTTGQEGLCMFAIDCLKANGTHLGTCIDRFYFGSCCQIPDKSTIPHIVANNIEDNSIDNANFVHPLTEDKIHSTVNKISDNVLLNKDKTEVTKVDVKPIEQNEVSTNKPVTVNDITDPDKVETKSDELTTLNVINDDVKTTNVIYTTVKEATTQSVKISHITEVTELPIKLSTFQSVSGENNNVVTEKTESKPTISEIIEVTSVKPIRKPTKPTYKPRPPYRPTNFTRPSISPKPRPTKPITLFNTTRKPPYRPPPKRPSTKKPLVHPPRLNITIIPQSTSPRPIFTRPILGTITYISTTGSKVEERPVITTSTTTTTTAPTPTTTTTTSLPTTTTTTPSTTSTTTTSTTTTTTTTVKPTTTSTTTSTTTETVPLTTERITDTTENVVADALPNSDTEKNTEKPTDKITERITELQSETTEPMQIVTQNDATVVTENDILEDKVTEKEILKPATEAEIPETVKPATATEIPVTSKPASEVPIPSNKPTTETPPVTSTEASSKAPEPTTEADEWSPITPPEGWVLISTISPKPETTKPQTTQNPTEVPDTTDAAKTTVSEAPSSSTTTTASPTSEMEFVVNITLSPTAPTTTSSMGLTIVTLNQTQSTTSKPIEDTTTANVTSTTEVPTTTTESYNMSNYKEVCGRRMWPQARIVGGAKSGFGQWPWQISLRQYRTSTYLHKCGAALLNENWAITAAHCVERVPPSELLVRLGEYDLANEEEPYGFAERRVQIVASHPHFDPATFEYDLALLRFYEPVTFQPNILPVCVPDDDDDYVGRTAYVTGWGRLYDEGPLPSVLQEVEVPVINNTACESMYLAAGYNEHIPNIFICAGWKKGGSDSCEGDSGGPMVVQRSKDSRFVLSGIISWGIGCAEPNQPGVYTRISEFRDWINQILQF